MTQQSRAYLRSVPMRDHNLKTVGDKIGHLSHCCLNVPVLLVKRASFTTLQNSVAPEGENNDFSIGDTQYSSITSLGLTVHLESLSIVSLNTS